ncbi:type III secretion system cytoplasmic ring protein SctQ [Chitinimonas lacunae]|uniref:Type III secretion system cytoplasmic ring protein SctQ n=1 Tax=Chitinimonas lacunae TaxID=1963018 RepID=A0ABV8MQ42_9NEIS
MNVRLRLPKLSREELGYRNLIARHGGALQFGFGGAPWRGRLRPFEADDAAGLGFAFEADWGGGRLTLLAPTDWASRWLRHVWPETTLETLPEPLALAAYEHLAARLGEALGSQLGRRGLKLLRSGAATAGHSGHGYVLELESTASGERLRLVLWLDTLALAFLAQAVRQAPPAELRLDELPLPLRLELGFADFLLEELAGLAPHDLIFLDECAIGLDAAAPELTLRLGGRLGFKARLDADRLTVTQTLSAIMSDVQSPQTLEAESFDQIPVRLTFDLGERSLTLAELRTLAPGHTFDLGRDPRHAVVIRANGRQVGEGELVEIDGRIGVAVLRVAPQLTGER